MIHAPERMAISQRSFLTPVVTTAFLAAAGTAVCLLPLLWIASESILDSSSWPSMRSIELHSICLWIVTISTLSWRLQFRRVGIWLGTAQTRYQTASTSQFDLIAAASAAAATLIVVFGVHVACDPFNGATQPIGARSSELSLWLALIAATHLLCSVLPRVGAVTATCAMTAVATPWALMTTTSLARATGIGASGLGLTAEESGGFVIDRALPLVHLLFAVGCVLAWIAVEARRDPRRSLE